MAAPLLRSAEPAIAKPTATAPVTVADSDNAWTLDNGIVKATISKRDGRMTALVFRGINTMGGGGYWESAIAGRATQSLTIDPAKNGGERAEIDLKSVGGRMDVELRYTLARGVSGIYVYGVFSHPASYPAAGYGENRYITKLNHTFNWLSVDADRNLLACTPQDWGAGVVVHAKEQRILSTGVYKFCSNFHFYCD